MAAKSFGSASVEGSAIATVEDQICQAVQSTSNLLRLMQESSPSQEHLSKLPRNLLAKVPIVKNTGQTLPAAKKFRQCGIEPEFEEKIDIMFKLVVATGNMTFNPTESNFSGIQADSIPEPITPNEELGSINLKDTGESSSIKRPRKVQKNKDKELTITLDRLVEVFASPISDASILECLSLLRSIP